MPINHIALPMRYVPYPGESSRTRANIIKACDGGGLIDRDNFSARNQNEATCPECKKLTNEDLEKLKSESRGRLLLCIAYKDAFEKGDINGAMRILEDDWKNYDDGKRDAV